jgi:rod shape-determining protein MreC
MGPRRTSTNHWFTGLLIIVLAILIFFAPSYGWDIRQFLSPSNPPGSSQADDQNVVSENEALTAQLAQLQVVSSELPTAPTNSIRAMVYSRYPLNFKNEILVNAGSKDGVAVGAAVVFQGILVGQVKSVFSDSALVQTVFDDTVKLPVRVGSGGYDGLLQGGSYPTVGSITKTAPVAIGDIVYSAAPGLPYGLPIGEVAATSTSADSLFEQASLGFSYDINNIETVFIFK